MTLPREKWEEIQKACAAARDFPSPFSQARFNALLLENGREIVETASKWEEALKAVQEHARGGGMGW